MHFIQPPKVSIRRNGSDSRNAYPLQLDTKEYWQWYRTAEDSSAKICWRYVEWKMEFDIIGKDYISIALTFHNALYRVIIILRQTHRHIRQNHHHSYVTSYQNHHGQYMETRRTLEKNQCDRNWEPTLTAPIPDEEKRITLSE